MLDVRCPEHLEAVKAFAASVGLAEQLQKQLDYLSDFGNASLPPGDPRRVDNQCTLFKDFAPHSFEFSIQRPDGKGGWRQFMVGGLLYEGSGSPADGSFPSLTVSLSSRTGWFVHT